MLPWEWQPSFRLSLDVRPCAHRLVKVNYQRPGTMMMTGGSPTMFQSSFEALQYFVSLLLQYKQNAGSLRPNHAGKLIEFRQIKK